eukprot:2454285-Amphidinium_carterae.1
MTSGVITNQAIVRRFSMTCIGLAQGARFSSTKVRLSFWWELVLDGRLKPNHCVQLLVTSRSESCDGPWSAMTHRCTTDRKVLIGFGNLSCSSQP